MGTIFSTNDIRGHAGETLTTEYVWNVGKGLAEWLPDDGTIVVVRSATADDMTVHALIEGALLQGRDVIETGQGDMQTVVRAVSDNQAAGGVLVAHDDLDNLEIITLFDSRGVVITDQTGLSEISQLVEAGNFIPANSKGLLKQ
ncbi:MAG: phosphomannomutase, phosphomannomutase [Candidatus Saccharibacteria bacterium]|nr:phosphomannomutase, phosphomannomutase [Candidatus Saccharibacteria bacterium]